MPRTLFEDIAARIQRRSSAFTGGLVRIAALAAAPALAAAAPVNDPARGWDELWRAYLTESAIIFAVFALIGLVFMLRYRRRSSEEQGSAPELSGSAALGWALIPAFVFMAIDFSLAARTWQLWNVYRDVPAERLEVKLDSAMWRWDFTYPNGVKSVNELRVPAGKPVLLRMTSLDVVHSFYIPEFRVKEDSMPGRVTYLWFLPREPGEYVSTCAEFCGMMHSKMTGKVIVMPPEAFAAWYEEEERKLAQQRTGSGG
ncbi:MAG TPA: cytochrome c oxidase subunit II [Burkholderiales bacterium]|nr:cytochrome c oxidase subunit II [Burkholderiales bacterium]